MPRLEPADGRVIDRVGKRDLAQRLAGGHALERPRGPGAVSACAAGRTARHGPARVCARDPGIDQSPLAIQVTADTRAFSFEMRCCDFFML
jgi:hypothetical protein